MAPWLRSVQKRDELMINGSVMAQLGSGQTKCCIDEKTEKNEQKRQRGDRGESGSLQTVPFLPPMQCGEPPTGGAVSLLTRGVVSQYFPRWG